MLDTTGIDKAIISGAKTFKDVNKNIAQSSEEKDSVFNQLASQMGLNIDAKKIGKPDMNIIDLGTNSGPIVQEEEVTFVQMPDPIDEIVPENDIERQMIEDMKREMNSQEESKKKVTTTENSENEVNEMNNDNVDENIDDVPTTEPYEVQTKNASDIPLSEIEDEYVEDEEESEENDDVLSDYLVSDNDYANTIKEEVSEESYDDEIEENDFLEDSEIKSFKIVTPEDKIHPEFESEENNIVYTEIDKIEENVEKSIPEFEVIDNIGIAHNEDDNEVPDLFEEDSDTDDNDEIEEESNESIIEEEDSDTDDNDEIEEESNESIIEEESEEDTVDNGEKEEIDEESEEDIDDIINDVVPEPTPEEVMEKSVEEINSELNSEYEMIFSNNVASVKSRYTNKQLDEFLTKNAETVNKDVIKDMYSEERIKYMNHLDFSDEEMNSMLWILVIGKYMDIYYGTTSPTHYQEPSKYTDSGTVEIIPYGKTDDGKGIDIKEDESVKKMKEYREREAYKYGKSNIDRALFEIEDVQDSNGAYDIFEDIRSLEKEFYDSAFYRIITQVMESDRFANMDDIKVRIIINEQTAYLPVIDFDTGIRLICIDTNDANQYRINPVLLNKNIKFSYNSRAPKLRILYLDNCTSRPISTVYALKKLIAFPKYINPKHMVELKHNYAVAYTTDLKLIDDFEKGNVDAREPGTSTYDQSKPHNRKVGIIILTKKSDKDKQAIRRNQLQQMRQNPLEMKKYIQDYDIHMVLSAGYICNNSRLNDVSLTPEERVVQYIITQYNECNAAVVKDGLQCICSAIIKEHREQFGSSVRFSIEFEHDRANLVSPAIIAQLDAQDGSIERSETYITNPLDMQISYILPATRRGMQGVQEFEKGRNDKRYFTKSTIQSRYSYELIRGYNLDTPDGQQEFVRSRGFAEFIEPKSVIFDIMPMSLSMLETSRFHNRMKKKSAESFIDRNSVDLEEMLNDQVLLEYEHSLYENDNFNGASRFLYNIIDLGIDLIQKENKT